MGNKSHKSHKNHSKLNNSTIIHENKSNNSTFCKEKLSNSTVGEEFHSHYFEKIEKDDSLSIDIKEKNNSNLIDNEEVISNLSENNEEDDDFLGICQDIFKDIEYIGEEKYSKFYKAYNIKEERKACLKVISKKELEKGDYDFLLKQIEREEEITKLCKCDNIVNIYNKYENEDYIIFELELCDFSLEKYMRKNGHLCSQLNFFKDILLGITQALKVMNEKGIIHRDIKPSNIYLIGKSTVKIGGFDYSIYSKENTHDPVGTIFYTAPEIIKNLQYDEKCDLWSVGITLYEILFGNLPYGKSVTPNLIKEIIYHDIILNFTITNLNEINILFEGLLTINYKYRISYNQFYNCVDNIIKIIEEENEARRLGYMCVSAPPSYMQPFELRLIKKYSDKNYETKNFVINKIINIIEGEHLPNIMNFPNGCINSNKRTKFTIFFIMMKTLILLNQSIKIVIFLKNQLLELLFCVLI